MRRLNETSYFPEQRDPEEYTRPVGIRVPTNYLAWFHCCALDRSGARLIGEQKANLVQGVQLCPEE
jgi:hypothetical protein